MTDSKTTKTFLEATTDAELRIQFPDLRTRTGRLTQLINDADTFTSMTDEQWALLRKRIADAK